MTVIGTWVNQGTIISSAVGGQPLVPNVIFESGAKILSGTVFKMWYSSLSNGGINYAESPDGVTWTQFASNPVIAAAGFGKIFKNGSTYYAYVGNSGGALPTAVNVYTSTDGVTWTLAKSNALVVGGVGTWDSATVL